MNAPPVTCVVVTFNRPTLLILCLEGLLKQDYPVSRIVLIDNASDIDTQVALQNNGYLEPIPLASSSLGRRDSLVKLGAIEVYYRRLEENTGGAGGFCEGLKRAFELHSADKITQSDHWFWLMDDDVVPTKDGLSGLMSFRHYAQCLHPRKRYLDGRYAYWEGRFNEQTGRMVWFDDPSFSHKKFVEVNYGCFEGMLIHAEVVAHIGFPDPRFFLVNDDLVYGLLASKVTKVLYVNHTALIRQLGAELVITGTHRQNPRVTDLTHYLNIRNHILLMEYLKRLGSARWLLWGFFLAKVAKEVADSLFLERSLRRAKLALLGLWDGVRGNFKGHERFLKKPPFQKVP